MLKDNGSYIDSNDIFVIIYNIIMVEEIFYQASQCGTNKFLTDSEPFLYSAK